MIKLAVFSRQNLMIAANSFSSMCTIAQTITQLLHVVYDHWTTHQVDVPAAIAETVDQYSVWTVKKISRKRAAKLAELKEINIKLHV